MIPLIMNNKNNCREEINRSTSDITGAEREPWYNSRCGRGTRGHWPRDGAGGDAALGALGLWEVGGLGCVGARQLLRCGCDWSRLRG